MSVQEIGYEAFMRAAPWLLRAAAPFHDKLQRGLRGRADVLGQLRDWSHSSRIATHPLAWIHAASVGEALMAQAIVGALREQRPDLQIAFTHFSPSAERMRDRVGADVAAYLPWDTLADMTAALDALRPSAIAFVRTEIWPTLTRLAAARRIPVALVNAVLAPTSSRLRPASRLLLRSGYARLHAVGAINQAAAQRYTQLGVSAGHTRVTRDARFDQVWQRVQSLDRGSALLQRLRDPRLTTLVAGSTWPGDEEILLPAIKSLTPLRLIMAPHEPDEPHLRHAEQQLAAAGLDYARLAAVEASDAPLPRVILVERVGVLADLYALADLSYVGGAFQRSGVHSVVEPAALGVPVVFGPRHANAAEAEELIAAGGAWSVRDVMELQRVLGQLLSDDKKRARAGAAGCAYVQTQLGGAQANARLIVDLLKTTNTQDTSE